MPASLLEAKDERPQAARRCSALDGGGVHEVRGDEEPGRAGTDAGGHVALGVRAISDLAVAVAAPTPEGAVRAQPARVVVTGCDRAPVGARPDAGGRMEVARGIGAELADVVVAPAPEGPVVAHPACVVPAGRDRGPRCR